MANILDYIAWRGDLKFRLSPFNEVDALIFAKLSYLEMNDILPPDGSALTIAQVAKLFFTGDQWEKKNLGDLMREDLFKLLRAMAKAPRYRMLKLKYQINCIDEKRDMQFSALTIDLGDALCIAFRGTDDTLVGWKEDLNMSVLDVVPSQKAALTYFLSIADEFPDQNFYLTGHSKGGNLAVYCATHIETDLQDRLLQIFSFDGPGFKESLITTTSYQYVSDLIVTLVPQSSIIGMCLEHEEEYIVVRSSETGLMQHNGFSWEVLGTSFVHLKRVTGESQVMDKTLKGFLSEMSIAQREQFINTLFDMFKNCEFTTVSEIRSDALRSATAILKRYTALDKDTRKALNQAFACLFSERSRFLREMKNPD